MITVLTGGTGGAKFVDGLRQIVPSEDLTIVVNTGDDMSWWGLRVSPDIDSISYMLAGKLSQERGWGVERDTFFALKTMRDMREPAWFSVGDRDLAMHIFRTKLLADGKTLSEATAEIAKRLDIQTRILPMTDSSVETRVLTAAAELSFEQYFVERRYQDEVKSVRYAGASNALPAPGVIDAIRSSDLVMLAPSNPVTSIGPILAVPGIREALRETRAEVSAVSPIVGNAAVTGPAGALLASQGFAVSIAGVAAYYRDILDLLVVDIKDAEAADEFARREELSTIRVHTTSTIMRNNDDRVALARSAIEACAQFTSASRNTASIISQQA
jgi:LPPG:FO 2-phospho-L-lactate transferase